MTLSLLDTSCGPSSPSSGPDWWKLVGALVIGGLLLFAGPLRCTAPVGMPPRPTIEGHFAGTATTWTPHEESEG